MLNHYDVLDVEQDASLVEIKRAFREKVKKVHPDITGAPVSAAMRRILEAYEVLSDAERRFKYDKIFRPRRPTLESEFDYQDFLKKNSAKPEYQAKLIFFDLFNFEQEDAVAVWQAAGGLDFPLEQHLDREDWMDCGFILAEELYRENYFYEAFLILTRLVSEERKKPYFRHFIIDVELLLKEIVRLKLKHSVTNEVWAGCMRIMLGMGFSPKEEAAWLKALSESLYKSGDLDGALNAFMDAKRLDPKIKTPKKLQDLDGLRAFSGLRC